MVQPELLDRHGDASGLERLDDAATRFAPSHRYLDDIVFLRAEALEGNGRAEDAKVVYSEILERFPTGVDHRSESAFRLAMMAFEPSPSRARELLQVSADEAKTPRDRQRATYWLARLLEASAPDEAIERYEGLFLGMSFYGLLSRERLDRLAPERAEAARNSLRAAAQVAQDVLRKMPVALDLDALAGVGLEDPEAWMAAALEEAACESEDREPVEIARS
ncbi:MAG: hypothetical protein HC923_04610 [Myxococcales bacterium]|nr:hypothetical protein [Myxococcales bacterium]